METISGEPAFVGDGLDRPECVLALANGEVWATDRSRGVARVLPGPAATPPLGRDPQRFLPNGIALLADGGFLIANIGLDGGVWRLAPHGRIEPLVTEADGVPLTVANFVLLDHAGRLWISVSTRRSPRERAFVRGAADGFIVVVEPQGRARIVADGLGFTNEVHVSVDGRWLYANETVGRRLSRFPIAADASLGARETVVDFGPGVFPDGMALDTDGGIWVTSVVSNRLLRIAPDGTIATILDQSDPEVIARVEERFAAGTFGRADMDAGRTGSLGNLSSLAFGGDDLRTIYLGTLFGTRIGRLRTPWTGAAQAHRHFTVDPAFTQTGGRS